MPYLSHPILTDVCTTQILPLAPEPLRVLYLCYFPVGAPLVQTQVVAYLAGLARLGHTIHLLTFEPKRLSPAERRAWRRRLQDQGIVWHHLAYHKRPTLPATMYDVIHGVLTGIKLLHRYRLNTIHARSHVAAAIGLILKKWTGCHLIFDIRGLLAEEYEDAGQWQRTGLPFRLTKHMERRCIAAADGIVVLTQRARGLLDLPWQKTTVIPCCADVDQIRSLRGERDSVRGELGLQDKTVLLYSGQLGTWYLAAEMVAFFAVARRIIPRLHLMILTPSDFQLIEKELLCAGIAAVDYTMLAVPPHRIGAYLAAADCAISFIKPCLSKVASSPTKIGEYLAAGLPIVSNSGIGDVDSLLQHIGVLVSDFTTEAYESSASQLERLIRQKDINVRCIQAAEETLSLRNIGVARYHQLYSSIAASGEHK